MYIFYFCIIFSPDMIANFFYYFEGWWTSDINHLKDLMSSLILAVLNEFAHTWVQETYTLFFLCIWWHFISFQNIDWEICSHFTKCSTFLLCFGICQLFSCILWNVAYSCLKIGGRGYLKASMWNKLLKRPVGQVRLIKKPMKDSRPDSNLIYSKRARLKPYKVWPY